MFEVGIVLSDQRIQMVFVFDGCDYYMQFHQMLFHGQFDLTFDPPGEDQTAHLNKERLRMPVSLQRNKY